MYCCHPKGGTTEGSFLPVLVKILRLRSEFARAKRTTINENISLGVGEAFVGGDDSVAPCGKRANRVVCPYRT